MKNLLNILKKPMLFVIASINCKIEKEKKNKQKKERKKRGENKCLFE